MRYEFIDFIGSFKIIYDFSTSIAHNSPIFYCLWSNGWHYIPLNNKNKNQKVIWGFPYTILSKIGYST